MALRLVPSSGKLRTGRSRTRTLATARLRKVICSLGLTQEEAGRLVGVDGRQVRRWLSGDVSLGALELLIELEAISNREAA
jgi:transcriptional regulator with XRE-family HTH domain